MQEDVENKTVALSVSATKLTGRVLVKAFEMAREKIKEKHQAGKTPQGRQSVKKLMNHCVATNSIPLDGETKLFDRVARNFNVDYSFHKTGPGKYLLLFKSAQVDAITAAFSEYTKLFMAREKKGRTPIREQLARFAERVHERLPQRERTREVSHGDR